MKTSPRVNLLNKGEQRHQGAVSRRFVFIGIVVTPILLIALLSSVKLIQYTGVQAELKSSREIWENIEPRLELYKAERRGLASNKQAMELINGWTNAQVSFVGLLEDIQGRVPHEIQFSRLSIRSEVDKSLHQNAEDVLLDYQLLIEGVSQGNLAEDEVIRLRKVLLESPQVAASFDSINLASMRKRQGQEGVTLREFKLEGTRGNGGAE
jgi:hypothetical protein